MREIFKDWGKGEQEVEGEKGPAREDFYLVHRVLADFPQAYAALREAFRVRDETAAVAARSGIGVCSRCRCELGEKEERTK